MRPMFVALVLCLAGCGKKQGPEASVDADAETSTAPDATTQTVVETSRRPAQQFVRPKSLKCGSAGADEPLAGPDCVTAEVTCGQTIVGHTKGGVNRYDTDFYNNNYCWPGTRNHNGGDERVYVFKPDKSPRFKAGEQRQRVSVHFDSPCADLTFSSMRGQAGSCPTSTRICDTPNPFTRKNGRSTLNMTVDAGEVYYFLVEGADDEEGAFAITVECGT